MADKVKRYVGIADCHGIESFMPEEDANIQLLTLRASSNAQRHAVVYKCTLNEVQVEKIQEDIFHGSEHSFKHIVRQFKAWNKDDTITVALGYPPMNLEVTDKKMWNKIPNSKLDPWR